MRLSGLVSVAFLAVAPAIANAQWFDNFDSYLPGSINGQGGWQGWGADPLAAGQVVTAPALSSPHSQRIGSGADSVRQYSGVTSGAWTYTANLYVPSGNLGDSYFILLNRYADPTGPFNWSVQLQIDSTSGLIFDDQETNSNVPSAGSAQIPIIRDQWVPVRVEFDLGANTHSSYYNNTLIYSGTWKRGSATAADALAAVDLFHASGTGNVFWDNFSLVPAPSSLALLAFGGVVAGRRRRA